MTIVCLYAAVVPFQPIVRLPDGSPLRIAAAELVAPLVFLAALARPVGRLPRGITALVLALPILALFSTLLAATTRDLSGYALGKTVGLAYLCALSLAIVRCLDGGAAMKVLRALGHGAVASAVIGLAGFAAYQHGIAREALEASFLEHGRLCSTMPGDPNIFASLLAVGLVVTLFDPQRSRRSRAVRSCILVAALLASGSRSGAVAAIVGLGVGVLARSRDAWVTAARGAFVVAAAGTAAAVLLMTDAGTTAAAALEQNVSRTFTIESRFRFYVRALEQFADNPIIGLGIGGFRDLNTWGDAGDVGHFAVHNTYLWALVDLGLVGGLLVVALIVAAAWRALAARRADRGEGTAAIVAAGLIALAVFNLFVDGLYQRHFWLLIACAMALPAAHRACPPLPLAVRQARLPWMALAEER